MDVSYYLIDENTMMIKAMEQLDKVAKKVLFVTKDGKFVASITDGDIRRWILKKGNLDASVKDIANYNPVSISDSSKNYAKEYMKSLSIQALPVLDGENNIVSVIHWNDNEKEMPKTLNIPIVIMAGGLGKRLYPYTKILPKPLIPIGEIPIVEHIINRFHLHGVDQFYLVVNHKKNMIKAYFGETDHKYMIEFVDEDTPLGTGGGLSLLKGKINSTFILSNCDILIEEDYGKIYKHHKSENNIITMVCSLKNIRIPYGVIEISSSGEIESMKEKPEISFFANTGMYIVEPEVIDQLVEGEAVSFPDIVEMYRNKGMKVGVYPISEQSWLDMGQLEEMEIMKRRLSKDE